MADGQSRESLIDPKRGGPPPPNSVRRGQLRAEALRQGPTARLRRSLASAGRKPRTAAITTRRDAVCLAADLESQRADARAPGLSTHPVLIDASTLSPPGRLSAQRLKASPSLPRHSGAFHAAGPSQVRGVPGGRNGASAGAASFSANAPHRARSQPRSFDVSRRIARLRRPRTGPARLIATPLFAGLRRGVARCRAASRGSC
jgi:hypothetical protein